MPETSRRDDPIAAFSFRVELHGANVAAFCECSGFSIATEVVHRAKESTKLNLPGFNKFLNVMLKRGLMRSAKL